MADEITRMKRHTAEDIENAIDMLLESYTREEIDTMLENKVSKDGNKVLSDNNYSDEEKRKLAGIDIPAIKAEIGAIVNSGAKNLLKDNNVSTVIKNGITFTKSDDGYYHIEGTNTSSVKTYVECTINLEVDKEYIITSNRPFSGTETTQIDKGLMNLLFADNWTGLTSNGGRLVDNHKIYIKLKSYNSSDVRTLVCRFSVEGNGTVNDDIWLMIRDASIEDDTFVPYAPSNRELYKSIVKTQDLHSAITPYTNISKSYDISAPFNSRGTLFAGTLDGGMQICSITGGEYYTNNTTALGLKSSEDHNTLTFTVPPYSVGSLWWFGDFDLTITAK